MKNKNIIKHLVIGGFAFIAFCVAVWALCCIVEMLEANTVVVGTAAILFLCALGALFIE